MSVDGNQIKDICDDGIERAEYLIDMCKNIQSVIEQIEEEKRDILQIAIYLFGCFKRFDFLSFEYVACRTALCCAV